MATTSRARNAVARAVSDDNVPAKSAAGSIYDLLKSNEQELAMALPTAGVTPQQMIRTAVTVVKKNPELAKCTPASIAGALMHSAQVGLLPGGTLSHAHLVPYRNNVTGVMEAQFQIGWQGLVQLARRSGLIDSVYAEVIREGDQYQITQGLDRNLIHKPNYGGERGDVLFSYAVAHYNGGGRDWVVLEREQIEQRRMMSKTGSKNKGPWKDHYAAMAKKSAIKSLAPYLPLSLNDARTFDSDGQTLHWSGGETLDVESVPGDDGVIDVDSDEVPSDDDDASDAEEGPSADDLAAEQEAGR